MYMQNNEKEHWSLVAIVHTIKSAGLSVHVRRYEDEFSSHYKHITLAIHYNMATPFLTNLATSKTILWAV